MITQQRFKELVAFARKGSSLETMEAIKLAVHESIADEQTKNTELIAVLRGMLEMWDAASAQIDWADSAIRGRNRVSEKNVAKENRS